MRRGASGREGVTTCSCALAGGTTEEKSQGARTARRVIRQINPLIKEKSRDSSALQQPPRPSRFFHIHATLQKIHSLESRAAHYVCTRSRSSLTLRCSHQRPSTGGGDIQPAQQPLSLLCVKERKASTRVCSI